MISRLITTTGISLSNEDTPSLTPTPSPTPTPSVMSAPSPSPTPTSNFPGFCQAFLTVAIPESVAKETREIGVGAMVGFAQSIMTSYGYNTLDYQEPFFSDCAFSPVPVSGPWCKMGFGLTPTELCVTATYAGYQTPQSSIPGVTVEPQTGGGYPLPKLPDIPDYDKPIVDEIHKCLGLVGDALNSCLGIVTGNNDVVLDNVDECVRRIPPKIGDQLINVMGQVYGIGVGCGLDVPTIDEIIEGPPPTTGGPGPQPNYPTPTPTTGNGFPLPEIYSRPPYKPPPTPTESCPVPIVNIAAPACPVMPPPGDIIFQPVITINVPPPPPPGEPPPPVVDVYTPPPVVVVIPTPTPSPSPTPTPEEPAPPPPEEPPPPVVPPVVPPKPPEPPFVARLILPAIEPQQRPTNWEFGAACAIPAQGGKVNSNILWDLFGFTRGVYPEVFPPKWLDADLWPSGTKQIGNALANFFAAGINFTNKVMRQALPISNNFDDFIILAMGGVVEKWLGAPILPFLQGTIYNINYNNPQTLPGIPDLQGLFRKGAISEEIFRCLVRANGSYDSWQMKIAESSTLVPSLYDIIRLYRGKKIGGNEFEYYANLNGLKISTPQGKTDIATFLEATRAIPGVADLVRMMVRDAADNTIALKYETDSGFDKKFAGQLEEWSEQQGVDPEIMKYYWRAHWEIPSNTQLFDMLHKLRPNRRVGVVPANIVTTKETVKEAIQVNDLTPYWVDRVMATSYSSLTRIDAQRAFFIEAINEDQLFDAYMDLGYDSDNAQVLVDFTKELKRKRDAGLPGADKPTNIISQLKKYVISETNAYDRLIATGMKPQKAKAAVANSVRDRKEEARARCLKEAQRRFFRAEYDLLKYKSVVMSLGIPQENIEALVNETACLYDSRGKEINAGALCKAFKQNIIAADQFQNRLRLIGYDRDEAFIIAESCQIDKVVAIGKAKLQKEAKERAEIEKAKKAEEKRKKDEEKAKEKAEKARLAEEKKKEKEKKEAGEADETVLPVVK